MKAIASWATGKRGAALVEFAIVVMLLLTIVLGTIEFGALALTQLTLTQGAREGSREASLGRPVSTIETRVRSAAGLLQEDQIVITETYSTDNGATFPTTLGNNAAGTENNAPLGSLILIHCEYPYSLITGNFFSWFTGAENGVLTLRTSVIMRRE